MKNQLVKEALPCHHQSSSSSDALFPLLNRMLNQSWVKSRADESEAKGEESRSERLISPRIWVTYSPVLFPEPRHEASRTCIDLQHHSNAKGTISADVIRTGGFFVSMRVLTSDLCAIEAVGSCSHLAGSWSTPVILLKKNHGKEAKDMETSYTGIPARNEWKSRPVCRQQVEGARLSDFGYRLLRVSAVMAVASRSFPFYFLGGLTAHCCLGKLPPKQAPTPAEACRLFQLEGHTLPSGGHMGRARGKSG